MIRAVALIAGALLLTSCGSRGRSEANQNLTLDQAQKHALEYLNEALGALPAGVYLSDNLPDSPAGNAFSHGNMVPCDETPTGPVNLGVNYWVPGLPPASGEQYVDAIVKAWESRGVQVDHRRGRPGSSYSVYVNAEAGYRLSAERRLQRRIGIGGVAVLHPADSTAESRHACHHRPPVGGRP
ncbi:hypothetical protein NSK11_contig00267-0003 [Nocardia seriolae]|uniref:Lipoprotein n=1 Tax=Nocardia seriolae TaxID=37332 RepID=A0ABC9Z6E5_9NOCA|nr:hypothetical protein NS07_v2contig00265-0002 [Nocardia seriolae]GAP33434.1 hypothetical protein NSK11_contig00267-0003 [Nocardia seriolae]GEM28929.1 hypothetical protein NS2_71680 [Nocardia seriolae NBRC 15557]